MPIVCDSIGLVARQFLFAMLAACGFAASACAQPARPDAPPLAEAAPSDAPGVTLTLAATGIATDRKDMRVSRLVALDVPAGAAPSPWLAPGPFVATFEGDIHMRLRDFLFFSAQGRGKLTLSINGKIVLEVAGDDLSQKKSESVRLGKGKNHLLARYEGSGERESAFRLFWATRTSPPEPLSPMVLTHSTDNSTLDKSVQIREGRLLIAQFRCTRCHAFRRDLKPGAPGGMPELAMDAPSLADAGARLNADWMAAWITNPRALRPKAHMPNLFATGREPAPQARDIAAYLATLGKPATAVPDTAGKADLGARLFANLNCVACHVSPEANASDAPADLNRISLALVKSKFKPGALAAFLRDPSAHYAWIAMPNFRLSTDEAENLSAYLISRSNGSIASLPPGNAADGKKLVEESWCAQCHAIEPAAELMHFLSLDDIPPEDWKIGCMAATVAPGHGAPDFAMSAGQRAAILAFVGNGLDSLDRDCAPEFAERQITSLRCLACHSRDGRESLLATDLDAENQQLRNAHPNPAGGEMEGIAPDQRAPILTWAGEKLRPQWLASFVAGKIDYKPRYYLRARMPGFASRGAMIAAGIIQEHGCSIDDPGYGAPDAKLAEIGRVMVGRTPNESFGCMQCHAIGKQPPLAPFEAPAVNFMYATERLRRDYYFRWLRDPLRVDPDTKMPRFEDADGKTGIVDVFDANARKQYEAIWNYLLTGREIKPPVQ